MSRFLVMIRESHLTVDDYYAESTEEEVRRGMAAQGIYVIGDHLYSPMGTSERPHLYKTIANAGRVARDQWAFMSPDKNRQVNERKNNKILLFEPSRLLEVTEDVLLDTPNQDRDDDLVIAERQIQLWSERLRALVEARKAIGQ